MILILLTLLTLKPTVVAVVVNDSFALSTNSAPAFIHRDRVHEGTTTGQKGGGVDDTVSVIKIAPSSLPMNDELARSPESKMKIRISRQAATPVSRQSPSASSLNNVTSSARFRLYREAIVDYVRNYGLPEDCWAQLRQSYSFVDTNRDTVKRLLLGCPHRYVALDGEAMQAMIRGGDDRRSISVAPLSGDPNIFGLRDLATRWSLYVLDDRLRRSIDERHNPRRFTVYRVLESNLRTNILADAMENAFRHWLDGYKSQIRTRNPVNGKRSTFAACEAYVAKNYYDQAPFGCWVQRWIETTDYESRTTTAPWCRFERRVSSANQRRYRHRAELDIGVSSATNGRAFVNAGAGDRRGRGEYVSYEDLARSSPDGRSIRLNGLAKWYVRLTEITDPQLSRDLEATIAKIHRGVRRRSVANSDETVDNWPDDETVDNWPDDESVDNWPDYESVNTLPRSLALPFDSADWNLRIPLGPGAETIDRDKDAKLHSTDPGIAYSLYGVVAIQLGTYFGFEQTRHVYPYGLIAEVEEVVNVTTDEDRAVAREAWHYFPWFRELSTGGRRRISNLYSTLNNWQYVVFNAVSMATVGDMSFRKKDMPHDDRVNRNGMTEFEKRSALTKYHSRALLKSLDRLRALRIRQEQLYGLLNGAV